MAIPAHRDRERLRERTKEMKKRHLKEERKKREKILDQAAITRTICRILKGD